MSARSASRCANCALASAATCSSRFQSRNACAVSRASVSAAACASRSSRWAGARSSDWCACWPCRSTSHSPASLSCARVAARPLMKQRERPARSSERRSTRLPGSPARSRSASHASMALETSNSPESSARSAPSRTKAASARPPTSSSIASTRMDLPAPVSPVSAVKPAASSSEACSISTKSRTASAASILFVLDALLAPAELLAQRGEVAIAGRMDEAHDVGGALEDEAIALAHVGEREAVEMRARIERLLEPDLDDAAVADAHRPGRKRVRREWHERERRHCRMQDRPLRRERIGGGAGRRGDDHAVGAQRVDEFAVERELELDEAPLRALADHRFVERDGAQHRLRAAQDLRVEHRALFQRVLAVEDRADAGAHVAVADVGHEADAPEIHTDHGNTMAHEIARGGEQRAVAADHHGELRSSADLGVVEPGAADLLGGFLLDESVAAARLEECDQFAQRCTDLRAAELADQRDAAEARFRYGGHRPASVQ